MAQQPHLSTAIGYFHWPPIWIGDIPSDHNRDTLNEEVCRHTLKNGIAVKAIKHGVFVFDFSASSFGYIDPAIDWIEKFDLVQGIAYKRLAILNAHLACLYSAFADQPDAHQLRKMMVTPLNTIMYHAFDNSGSIYPESSVVAQIKYMQSENLIPAEFEWWKRNRSARVSVETVVKSFEQLEKVLTHEQEDALDLVQLYTRSCISYEDHDYSLSLTLSWTVIEKLLNFLWANYLEQLNQVRQPASGKEKFINNERKRSLIDGRDYSASVIAEILSLAGVIPASLYEDLKMIRGARNKWVHNLSPVKSEKATDALMLLLDMMRLVYQLEFKLSLYNAMML